MAHSAVSHAVSNTNNREKYLRDPRVRAGKFSRNRITSIKRGDNKTAWDTVKLAATKEMGERCGRRERHAHLIADT